MSKKSIIMERTVLWIFVSLFSAALFINSSEIRESVIRSLQNCILCVIPSLFPFMIISKIIINCGMTSPFENTVGRILHKLYNLPPAAAGPFLLGITCSFPIGAKSGCELLEQGKINKEEAQEIIALSNNTGPAFIIAAVGELYWSSKAFGVVVYLIQIISAVLCGFIFCKTGQISENKNSSAVLSVRKESFLSTLSDSISSSAVSALSISGFIVFFSVLIDMATAFLNINSPVFCAAFSSLLEFSSGALNSSKLGGRLGAALTGFAIGFGGLSVICQSVSFCSKYKISIKKTVVFKLTQGLICAGSIFIITSIFPGLISHVPYKSVFVEICPYSSYAISVIVLFASVFGILKNKSVQKINADIHYGK